ncbi:MAG: preprotein translocase subunit YajC [Sedimentisphaerales bacterium]|nr:preprotein translocase subunit YajC [Sedimentisphaerales bacterium]
MNNIWILAEKDGDASSGVSSEPVTSEGQPSAIVPDKSGDPNAAAGTPARKGFGQMQFIFLALMFVMMYFILFRAPRKKQQQHKQMVQSLAKNDKVRTIGGIIGTVVDVKGDEVILKVDESNNTKIRLSASAIGKNLTKDNGQ